MSLTMSLTNTFRLTGQNRILNKKQKTAVTVHGGKTVQLLGFTLYVKRFFNYYASFVRLLSALSL